MTRKELLLRAKELGVKGRYDMDTPTLERAVVTAEFDSILDTPPVSAELVREAKAKLPSRHERDEEGRVIRKGKNLSGNSPWRRKPYYLNPAFADPQKWSIFYRDAFKAAPNQVQKILETMIEHNITSPDVALCGGDITSLAIQSGKLQTKIKPNELFAYYRRTMDRLGLICAR